MPKVIIVADIDLEKLEAELDVPGTYMVYTEPVFDAEDEHVDDDFILDVTGASAELDNHMREFFGKALKDGVVGVWSGEELLAETGRSENTKSFLSRVLGVRK